MMLAGPVELQQTTAGVLLLSMRDRNSKNGFSEPLVRGLIDAFASIATSDCRVVVLTGYENYFATGGTRDGLLAMHAGNARFADTALYSLALECRVPVIAAMQGHAIGGGLVFGLFADFVVLARESVYTANFMKYGFTPGMGATCVLPAKLGAALGHELLIGARSYRGAELEKRGIPFPVLPRAQVQRYALELAGDIAQKPRGALVALKDHLCAALRANLPGVVKEELRMHDATFGAPEVGERIRDLFSA